MVQARIHGRGGQGVVTAAELLSVAAFLEDRYAQAFPTFGSERMGAPVTAFCRIDDRPIRLREPVVEPDGLIVQDPTLVHQVDLFGGVGPDAFVLVNTERSFHDLGLAELEEQAAPGRLLTVAAGEIAREHTGRPLPNAALLGAFAALTGWVSLASISTAVRERFPGPVGEANVAAAAHAHADVLAQLTAVPHG